MGLVVLYRERTGFTHSLSTPLAAKTNAEDALNELGLPGYLDLSEPIIRRIVVTLWAIHSSANTAKLEGKDRNSIGMPLLVGGGAVKVLSPTANERGSPLNRKIGDADFVSTRRDGTQLIRMLTHISEQTGNAYHYFLTDSDKMFNALRGGSRYRIRGATAVSESDAVVSTTDILVGAVDMRHRIDILPSDFERARENLYTVGPEKLLLTKAQVITELDYAELDRLKASGQEFRILNHQGYKKGMVIIGMEAKDMLDVCAILLDRNHRLEVEPRLDLQRLTSYLRHDEKLALTVRLNLENLVCQTEWIRSKGLTKAQTEIIRESTTDILGALPAVSKAWKRPWWNTEVDSQVVS